MTRIRITLLALAACGVLTTQAAAATDPKVAATKRLAPITRPTPAMAAAARAAALARAAPVVVPANLPPLSAQQIVDRNTQARGGQAALQRVDAMTFAGKLEAGKARQDGGQLAVVGKQARARAKAELRKALDQGTLEANAPKVIQLPFQMDLKRPAMTRLEIPFQGQTAVQVYDGTAGWKLRPFLGRNDVEPFSPEELKIASSQQALDGPLIDHAAKGTAVAVEGGEMIEGRGAYRLKLTLKNGEVRHLWIDAQNFLDVKIEGAPHRVDGKWHPVYTYFRDYKPVGGLQIAHQLDTAVEGVPGSQRIFIEKVALNPVLDASRFARPQ
ncbi:hypothetical protein BH11PSE8_BH11PSE8_39870 [soil metagenome]